MRIKRLSLLAFGAFDNRELVFADPGALDVVYGPNEAGKSTSLRAVTSALFGIDAHTKDAFRHDMPDLRIGATLLGAADESFAFVRRKGKKGNTLLDDDGKSLDEALLGRWLGGATRELFESTYGLDHGRLREGAEALLAGEGDLGETLFGASLGSVSLHALRKQVEQEAEAIYVPRGKVPPLNQALAQLDAEKKRLVTDATLPEVYETQRRGIAEHTAENVGLAKRRAELVGEATRLAQLEKMLPELDDARRRFRQLEVDERACAERRAALVVDVGLLQMSDTMQAVRERLSEQRKAVVELPEARSAFARVELEVADALRSVGREGDPEALLLDAATQAEIERLSDAARRWEEREEHASAALRRARARLSTPTDTPADAETDTTALEAALSIAREAGDGTTIAARLRARIHRLDDALRVKLESIGGAAGLMLEPPSTESVQVSDRAMTEAREHKANAKQTARASEDELTACRLEIGRLEAQGVPPSPEDVSRLRADRDAAWDALAEARGEAKKKAESAFLDRMRAADDSSDQLLRESSRAATHQQLVLLRDAATRRLDTAQRAENDAAMTLVAVESEWRALSKPLGSITHERARSWIKLQADARADASLLADTRDELEAVEAKAKTAIRALAASLAPFGVVIEESADLSVVRAQSEKVLARVAEVKSTVRDLKTAGRAADESVRVAEADVVALEEARAEWRRPWRKLLARLGLDPEASREAAVASVDAHRRLALALASRATTSQRVRSLERTTADLEELMNDILVAHAPDLAKANALEAAQELVKRATANDAAAAEATLTDQKLGELRTSAGRERASIARLEEIVREASSKLADPSLAAAHARSSEIEIELEEIDRQIEKNQRQIGGWEAAMRDDMRSSIAAATANDVEETLAKVAELAQRYAQLKLASAVLTREIEAFRERNQGPILQRASEHFAFLTSGRYAGLRAGFGKNDEPVLRAMQGKGDVGVEGLSLGTRDALYLALRLGSWQHLAKTNVSLPIVLDDVLVDFDDDRASAAIERLGEVARDMQVVLFTHHRKIVESARAVLGARVHVSELVA